MRSHRQGMANGEWYSYEWKHDHQKEKVAKKMYRFQSQNTLQMLAKEFYPALPCIYHPTL